MAVQKSKVTRARRDKRRASNFNSRIKPVSISVDPTTGDKHLSHHMTKDGYYKGVQITSENDQSE